MMKPAKNCLDFQFLKFDTKINGQSSTQYSPISKINHQNSQIHSVLAQKLSSQPICTHPCIHPQTTTRHRPHNHSSCYHQTTRSINLSNTPLLQLSQAVPNSNKQRKAAQLLENIIQPQSSPKRTCRNTLQTTSGSSLHRKEKRKLIMN